MILGFLQIGEFDISVNKKCCIAQLLQKRLCGAQIGSGPPFAAAP
jgi:hypothetical protein